MQIENRPDRIHHIISVIVIIIGIWILYRPTLYNAFVYDDPETITKNPYIKDLNHIPSYFSPAFAQAWSVHPRQQQYYRPIPLISFALNYRLAGLNPAMYHLTNIFFHITVTLLLFALILKTHQAMRPGGNKKGTHIGLAALFAALLFALHPIQTESVTYIVSRSVVICAIFILVGLWGHLISLEQTGRRRFYWRCFAVTSFTLALMSKETAIIFPLLLLSMVWSHARSNDLPHPLRTVILQSLPFFLILAVYLVMRVIFIGQAKMATIGNKALLYFLTASKALFIYLKLLFIPISQNVDHHLPIADSPADPTGLIAAVGAVALFVFVIRSSLKTPGFASFWFSWFFLAIMPNLVLPTSEAISEHSAYLPSMGIFTFVAWGFVIITQNFGPWGNAGNKWCWLAA